MTISYLNTPKEKDIHFTTPNPKLADNAQSYRTIPLSNMITERVLTPKRSYLRAIKQESPLLSTGNQ